MKFSEYFHQRFPNHLRRLKLRQPSSIVRKRMMNDSHAMFFGGRNWDNIDYDLSQIAEEYRSYFVLSLFMIVISDQNLYRYFKDDYPEWRRRTQFPKFGWSGFGYHIENPMKILTIPEQEKLVGIETTVDLIPEFASFFKNETQRISKEYQLKVSAEEFFESMINDSEFVSAEGNIAEAVQKNL